MKASTLVFALLAAGTKSVYATYFLTDNIVGGDFYRRFEWQAIKDPTHGRVNYVDQRTSIRENLTYASYNSFVLRTDSKTVLDPSGPGRNSVRIMTKKTYTTHISVFDVRHMPQGCGTWPAIWATTEVGWPDGGEIDIVEGVNDQGPNSGTLHTTEGCTMPETRPQTGFVMQRTNRQISIWFWGRNDPRVPREIKDGDLFLEPGNWGVPAAFFPNTDCDMKKHFGDHKIIINLTLCGDWAGNVYGSSGCPSTCVDWVNNNPANFTDAYFDFAAIRIYETYPFL